MIDDIMMTSSIQIEGSIDEKIRNKIRFATLRYGLFRFSIEEQTGHPVRR